MTARAEMWEANVYAHFRWRDVEGVEGDIPAELFTEQGLPDVGVDAFVVVGSWVRDLVWGERVMFGAFLEGKLSRACEHGPLQFLEDFPIEGVNLGRGGSLGLPLLVNNGFGRRLYSGGR